MKPLSVCSGFIVKHKVGRLGEWKGSIEDVSHQQFFFDELLHLIAD